MSRLPQPNYTQIPNILLDNMSKMEDSELRILLAAARLIIGWHKTGPEPISLAQFRSLTGMSNKGVRAGIELAICREWLVISDKKGKRGTNCYELNFSDYAPEEHSQLPDYAPGAYSQKSNYAPEEHSQLPDYAPEEHGTMFPRNHTKESISKKGNLKKEDSFTPDGVLPAQNTTGDQIQEVDPKSPFVPFIETELFEEKKPDKIQTSTVEENPYTSRPALQQATMKFFQLNKPANDAGWSYLNLLVNFFTGSIKPDTRRKQQSAWYEFQLLDTPFDALDIIGMKLWYEDQYEDPPPLQKPATIADKASLYLLSPKRDYWRDRAKGRLRKLMTPPKVKDEIAPEDMATPDQVTALDTLFADTNKLLGGQS